MKKKFHLRASLMILGALAFSLPLFALAQVQISTSFPNSATYATSSAIGGFVANFYEFSLMIGGVLALGVIIYGGILYMTSAGSPNNKHEAKEWIEGALLGLLLLAGAYFVLNFINPQLVRLDIPLLQSVNVGGGTGGGNFGGGTTPTSNQQVPNSQACLDLQNVGVGVSCSMLTGIQSSTVDMLTDLTNECHGDAVSVSSVTGGAHSTSGGCTHANGYKADVRPNAGLSSCIRNFTPDGTRGDGAPLYQSPDGAVYADETVKPPKCGSNGQACDWTGAHWDIAACGVQ